MSLDVYLTVKDPVTKKGTGVFVRDDGSTRELTSQQVWDRMSLFVGETGYETNEVYSANITNNLGSMASAAGLYYPLWRPEEVGLTIAGQLIPLLEVGLKVLELDRERLKLDHSPENGWGSYEGLVEFVTGYLEACREHPEATVEVSR